MKNFVISIAVLVALVVGLIAISGPSFDEAQFNDTLRQVVASDQLATSIFQVPEDVSNEDYAQTARGGISLYQENIRLLNEQITDNVLPAEQKELAEDVIQYTELRIEQFELLEQSATDDTQDLFPEISSLAERIENLEIYRQGALIEALEAEVN